MLAHFVENNIEPTLMQQIIQMIRNGLQAIGFNLPASETEMFKVIAKARRHIIQGKAKGSIITTAPAAMSFSSKNNRSSYITKTKVKALPKQGKVLPNPVKIENVHQINQEQAGSLNNEAYIQLTVPTAISKQITRILYRTLPDKMKNDFGWPTSKSSSGDIFRVYGKNGNDIEGAKENVEVLRKELLESPVYYSRTSTSGKKGISNRNVDDVETWLSGTKFEQAKARGHKVVVIQSIDHSGFKLDK
jgi:hypothetical protein